MTKNILDEFGDRLGKTYQEVLRHGFTFPIHVVMVSRNGSIFAFETTRDESGNFEAKTVVSHFKTPPMDTPFYIFIVDTHGRLGVITVNLHGWSDINLN